MTSSSLVPFLVLPLLALLALSAFAADTPPNLVDLRPKLRDWGLESRTQGGRGTCSVLAIAGALEYAAAKKQGHGTRLSVEFSNWAGHKATGRTADGGFFSEIWRGFETYGACPEADLPYRAQYDADLQPPVEALEHAKAMKALGLRLHWIKEWDVKTGMTEEQLQDIKRTLDREWPVCGGMRWPKQAQWKDDLLQMCPPEEVFDGHSVLLVGYREDAKKPGGGVFLIRNSGGDGRDGYLSYEYVRTYMNDAVWIDYPAGTSSALFRDLLGRVASLPTGRNRRVSSNEQPNWNDGNFDMTPLPPGQVLELPVLKGPGVITHFWFTSHAGGVNELNALSLRIYWDGRKEPGVEVPLGEFFAVGQGKPAVVESFPVQVSPSGSLSSYWRMPFARSARIVITNDNPDRTSGLYWQVDWVELDALPADTPYFHARYRQEYPAEKGRDYLIADLQGQGQYVGTVMSVTLAQDGWFGEGDDFFYVDGEEVPSLQGTGTEDYFNDAWGFRPRTSHWFGQPRWQGYSAGDSGVMYRWHLLDPVGFTKSLKVAIEHKGNRAESEDGWYIERPDFYNSIAFWYQTGEPKPFGHLPPWPERRVPWQHHHLVRTFRHATFSGKSEVSVQTQGFFGARPTLAWSGVKPGSRLTLPFEVEQNGRYAVRLTALGAPDYGVFDVQIDGKTVKPLADFGSQDYEEVDLLLGTHMLSQGEHTLTFRARKAKPLSLEMLRLLKLPPEAERKVKTGNEAHFIRLGIGRALYAYRLTYGELPASLEELVKSGIMPKRYLTDENGHALKASREGEYFVVESTAPAGWKHKWLGLDARR